MFKKLDPKELADDAQSQRMKIEAFVYIPAAVAGLLLSYIWNDFWQSFFQWILLIGCWFLSIILGRIAWEAATLWLGKIGFRRAVVALSHPDKLPKTTERIWESWSDNEPTISAFYVIFRLACLFGLFSLLSPIVSSWVK